MNEIYNGGSEERWSSKSGISNTSVPDHTYGIFIFVAVVSLVRGLIKII